MQLSDLGAQVATMGDKEKAKHAADLIKGKADVGKYTPGVCYDTVAYVTALQSPKIKPDDLMSKNGDQWTKVLFNGAKKWDGKKSIKAGKAVGFYRLNDKKFFHAATATGGSKVRAVNGHLLGVGWKEVDLGKVLGTPDENGVFAYDGAQVEVHISKL